MNMSLPIEVANPKLRQTKQSHVSWGSNVVTVGDDAPVRVQSMTNTDTVDVIGTAIQVKSETTIVIITQRYNLKKDLKVGLIARASLK